MLIAGMAALIKAAGLPRRTSRTTTISRALEAIGEADARLDEEVTRSLHYLLFRTSEMVGDLMAYLSERRR